MQKRSLILSGKFFTFHFSLFTILVLCVFAFSASAQQLQHYNSPLYSPKNYDPNDFGTSNGMPEIMKRVGIVQRLNEQIPLDVEFKNEDGKTVKIGEYFNQKRPVILALVYYECPMLCNEVLNGLTGTLKSLTFSAGKDFDVLAISFDARENDKSELAKRKKQGYLERYQREGSENGWHFLTGSQESIDKITQAVGFNYEFDKESNQFAHNGGIMVITPEGKISRYFYGIDYAPKDLKFAVMESSQEKIGNVAEQLLLYCYHYDPSKGKYGLQILSVMRLVSVAMLIGMGTMFFVYWRKGKKKSS
jgi:protein SCO1